MGCQLCYKHHKGMLYGETTFRYNNSTPVIFEVSKLNKCYIIPNVTSILPWITLLFFSEPLWLMMMDDLCVTML